MNLDLDISFSRRGEDAPGIQDLDLGFALRALEGPGLRDLDISFSRRYAAAAVPLDLDLNFALDMDTNVSLSVVKHGAALTFMPLLMLVGGVLVDPVNGDEWAP